jgi:glycosyltransferase involved in cell wall biosynthesis
MESKVLIFLPTYNDYEVLNEIVCDIKQTLPLCDVVIVDDGSMVLFDAPREVFYVRLPFNLGLGVATHVAMDFALRHGYEYLIRMDADGQHSASYLSTILENLAAGNNIVVGTRTNRHKEKGGKNIFKKLVQYYFYVLAKITTSREIPTDLNSGFIGFDNRAVHVLNDLELDRFPEPQIVLYGAYLGLKIGEVDVLQQPRTRGVSTVVFSHAFRLVYRFTMYNFIIWTRKRLL